MERMYEQSDMPIELVDKAQELLQILRKLVKIFQTGDFSGQSLERLQSEYEEVLSGITPADREEILEYEVEIQELIDEIRSRRERPDFYLFSSELSTHEKLERLAARRRMAGITGNALTAAELRFWKQFGHVIDQGSHLESTSDEKLGTRRFTQLRKLVEAGHSRTSIQELVLDEVRRKAVTQKWKELYGSIDGDPEMIVSKMRARMAREDLGLQSEDYFENLPYSGIGGVGLMELLLEPDYVSQAYQPAQVRTQFDGEEIEVKRAEVNMDRERELLDAMLRYEARKKILQRRTGSH